MTNRKDAEARATARNFRVVGSEARAREMLERAAKRHGYESLRWDANCWKAALEAMSEVQREAIERAAMVAAIHSQYPATDDFDRGYGAGRKAAASAIRSLGDPDHADVDGSRGYFGDPVEGEGL